VFDVVICNYLEIEVLIQSVVVFEERGRVAFLLRAFLPSEGSISVNLEDTHK
jgi:hypothetical protein